MTGIGGGSWVWRKSSHSEANGNSDCVEVGYWRKSSVSESNGNSSCVEVGFGPEVTAVRDSKNPDGGMLAFSGSAWDSLRLKITRD